MMIDRSPHQGLFFTGDIRLTHLLRTAEFKARQKCVFEVVKILRVMGRIKVAPREEKPADSFSSVERKNHEETVDACEV